MVVETVILQSRLPNLAAKSLAKLRIFSENLLVSRLFVTFAFPSNSFSPLEQFTINILGCGCATPTVRHNPSAQLIVIHGKQFLMDCGEGIQKELLRQRISLSRLTAIFISHLHGDHIFGLPGLISTLALTGRTADLHIYGHADLEQMLRPWLDYFCRGMAFSVIFHSVDCSQKTAVYSDRSVTVYSLPLRHRVPATGYLFEEATPLPHIRRDMIDAIGIPHHAINGIKHGEGWHADDGTYYPHEHLTTPARPARSYAYVSDTCYLPRLAEQVKGVTLLYHEATYVNADAFWAKKYGHSTAGDAANIAKAAGAGGLVIGHFSARYRDESVLLREAQEVFPLTTLAKEGKRFEVGV